MRLAVRGALASEGNAFLVGLMVVVIQLAITLGAVFGGVLFDMSGYQMTFAASAVLLLVAALLAILKSRKRGATD